MIHIHSKNVLLPLGIGTACSLLGDATLYTVLPTHTQEVGVTLASVGIILGINRAIRIVLNGPAGVLYDRLPRRGLFVLALSIGAFSTAIYAASQGLWMLLLGRLLWGLSWSLIWVGGTKIILDISTDKDRGHLMGLYQTWFFLGQAVGALAGGVLTDMIGYTATMWVGTGLAGIGTLTALLFLPETHKFQQAAPVGVIDKRVHNLGSKNGLWTAASIYGVNRFITAGVLSATLGLLVKEQMKIYHLVFGLATVTGILMALRTVLSMLASVSSGKASDWLGSRWRLANWVLFFGAIGMALLVWDFPLAIVAGISLGAIAAGGLQTISSTLPGDLIEQRLQGAAIGALHTAGDFGSAVGPPVAYALLPWLGLPGIYLLCAGLFLAQMIPVIKHQIAEKMALQKITGSSN